VSAQSQVGINAPGLWQFRIEVKLTSITIQFVVRCKIYVSVIKTMQLILFTEITDKYFDTYKKQK